MRLRLARRRRRRRPLAARRPPRPRQLRAWPASARSKGRHFWAGRSWQPAKCWPATSRAGGVKRQRRTALSACYYRRDSLGRRCLVGVLRSQRASLSCVVGRSIERRRRRCCCRCCCCATNEANKWPKLTHNEQSRKLGLADETGTRIALRPLKRLWPARREVWASSTQQLSGVQRARRGPILRQLFRPGPQSSLVVVVAVVVAGRTRLDSQQPRRQPHRPGRQQEALWEPPPGARRALKWLHCAGCRRDDDDDDA